MEAGQVRPTSEDDLEARYRMKTTTKGLAVTVRLEAEFAAFPELIFAILTNPGELRITRRNHGHLSTTTRNASPRSS